LGECDFTESEQEKVLQALQKNKVLIFLNIGTWKTMELSDQYEFQIQYNKSELYKVQLLSWASISRGIPYELFSKIGRNLNALSLHS
jgi:hypothetical protein